MGSAGARGIMAGAMAASLPSKRALGLALPNVLSGVRLGCAVLFPMLAPTGRLALVIIAALSDGLDGLAARTLGHPTWWGGLMDAGGDKVFMITVVVDLTVRGELTWWQALLLLARDLTVIVIVAYMAVTRRWTGFRHLQPGLLGKATTAVLFLAFIGLIGWPAHRITLVLVAVGMTLSALAAGHYGLRLIAAKRDTRDAPT